MKFILNIALVFGCALSPATLLQAQQAYRLGSVDIKQPLIWGAECRQPDGSGLAFGGQDQDAEDGRPHTRLLVDGQWKAVHQQLQARNPLADMHAQVAALRSEAKNMLARARAIYFKGLPPEDEAARLRQHVVTQRLGKSMDTAASSLPVTHHDAYARGQAVYAQKLLQDARKNLPTIENAISPAMLRSLHRVQIQLELAAESLDAEPPPRAMNCGAARLPDKKSGPAGNTLVYDAKTKSYFLFGGDHLDYLTNDIWSFDTEKRQWFQLHPEGAPPPRANHRLTATGNGVIQMTGGYKYTSNTGYVSGQYIDINDGPWTYDIRQNKWSGGELVAGNTRVYREGAFHPDFYFNGAKPDAATFEKWLNQIPVNQWMPTNPPHLPRLNRDWGTARIDTHRDMILRWSGGHSAHGGSDVLHFHFSTNRWELPNPVEFPLGQLYSNTSYPNGYNFNLRPWITGHTYQNYAFDPISKNMIKAGRPRHTYVYEPSAGDWTSRSAKPAAMKYNGCFYDLTLAATPHGIVCWGKNGRVHRYRSQSADWIELKLTGDKLPGSYVDNSSIAYDSRRDRLLIVNTHGFRKPYSGKVWTIDLKTSAVKVLTPEGHEAANQIATVDKCCYDAANDLLLMGAYLKNTGLKNSNGHTATPAYDCAENRWITLDLKYSTGKKYGNITRAFPHTRSDGLVFDPQRKLIWGVNTNGQVYVLRLDLKQANVKALQ